LRQRILDDEHRRLGDGGARQFRSSRCEEALIKLAGIRMSLLTSAATNRGKEQRSQIQAQMRLKPLAALIHGVSKHRLGFVELPPHVDVLRALAGKHENDRWILS